MHIGEIVHIDSAWPTSVLSSILLYEWHIGSIHFSLKKECKNITQTIVDNKNAKQFLGYARVSEQQRVGDQGHCVWV